MSFLNKHILSLIIVLLIAFDLSAGMQFKTLIVRNGMELYSVSSLYRDSLGYIWIGNSRGVSRFDGREVKTYPIKNEVRSFVSDIHEIDKNKLLVCSTSGLLELDRKTGELKMLAEYSESNAAYCVEVSSDKSLYYIGSKKSFDIYNTKTKKIEKRYLTQRYGEYVGVRDILRGSDNTIWIATTNGILHFDPVKQSLKFVTSPKVGYINDIMFFHDLLLIGTEKGLFYYNLKTHLEIEVPDFRNRIVSALTPENKSTIYVGTNGAGLMRFDVNSQKVLDRITHNVQDMSSLPTNSIYTLLYDQDSILWIGTASSGVCFSQNFRKKFVTYDYGGNASFQKQPARALCISGDTKLIGTRDGLIVSDKSGKSSIYDAGTKLNGLRANIILNIVPFPGRDGQFLIGTYGGGVSVFNMASRSFSTFIDKDPLLYGKVYSIGKDPQGYIWVSTFDGLIKCDVSGPPRIVSRVNGSSELKNNVFWFLYVDRKGRIWTGTDNGLAVLDSKTERFIRPKQLMTAVKERVLSCYENRKGEMWVCTIDGGIYVFDDELKLKSRLTKKQGLPDNNVVGVNRDDKGNYWISTMNGFARYFNGKVHTFSLSDGLPAKAFLQSSCAEDYQGNLWFGSENGLMYFNPLLIQENKAVPITTISDVKSDNAELQPVIENKSENRYKKIEVKGAENNLKITFVAFNYYNSEDNKFRFMLKGYDKHWRSSGSINNVEYKDLPSGHYQFIVYGSNNDGVWTKNPAILPVVVSYYFYQTIWFILLCVLCFTCGLYWVFSFYFKRAAIKLKNQILSSLPKKEKREPAKPKFGEDKSKEILDVVRNYMQEQKPYLDVNLKFSKVAEATRLQQIDISQAIGQLDGQSFADFINSYRVKEFIDRVANGGDVNLKVTSIAYECGFYSKASFYRAFKKATGVTPGEYFKEINTED